MKTDHRGEFLSFCVSFRRPPVSKQNANWQFFLQEHTHAATRSEVRRRLGHPAGGRSRNRLDPPTSLSTAEQRHLLRRCGRLRPATISARLIFHCWFAMSRPPRLADQAARAIAAVGGDQWQAKPLDHRSGKGRTRDGGVVDAVTLVAAKPD